MIDNAIRGGDGNAAPNVTASNEAAPIEALIEPGRRRERRLPCTPTSALVEFSDGAQTVEGRVVEVSKSGLRLILENRVPEGESVRIDIAGKMIVTGEVRYCRPDDTGCFETGILTLDAQNVQ